MFNMNKKIDPVPSIIDVIVEIDFLSPSIPSLADTAVVIKEYGPLTKAPVNISSEILRMKQELLDT